MTKDVRREEMSKVDALFRCDNNNEICFVGIEPKFIVCHPARYITETVPNLLRKDLCFCQIKICIHWCHLHINDGIINGCE